MILSLILISFETKDKMRSFLNNPIFENKSVFNLQIKDIKKKDKKLLFSKIGLFRKLLVSKDIRIKDKIILKIYYYFHSLNNGFILEIERRIKIKLVFIAVEN